MTHGNHKPAATPPFQKENSYPFPIPQIKTGF